MTVIGIVGTRLRDSEEDLQRCRDAFNSVHLNEEDRIVSGGCPKGGDRFAEVIAMEMKIPITIHYANWQKHGRIAGFIRNTAIAEDCDILIAVVDVDQKGGTEDTVKKVIKLKKQVILVK